MAKMNRNTSRNLTSGLQLVSRAWLSKSKRGRWTWIQAIMPEDLFLGMLSWSEACGTVQQGLSVVFVGNRGSGQSGTPDKSDKRRHQTQSIWRERETDLRDGTSRIGFWESYLQKLGTLDQSETVSALKSKLQVSLAAELRARILHRFTYRCTYSRGCEWRRQESASRKLLLFYPDLLTTIKKPKPFHGDEASEWMCAAACSHLPLLRRCLPCGHPDQTDFPKGRYSSSNIGWPVRQGIYIP